MLTIKKIVFLFAIIFIGNSIFNTITPTNAYAYDFSQIVTISKVEATYMPSNIHFQVSNGDTSCYWYIWYPHGSMETEQRDNIKSVYASLMTALLSNREVEMFVSYVSGNSDCRVEFIHFK